MGIWTFQFCSQISHRSQQIQATGAFLTSAFSWCNRDFQCCRWNCNQVYGFSIIFWRLQHVSNWFDGFQLQLGSYCFWQQCRFKFHDNASWGMVKIWFCGSSTDLVIIFWYFKGDICLLNCRSIRYFWIINDFQVQSRWEKISFSYQIEDIFSGTTANEISFTQKDLHSYMCFFFAFCKGSNFLKILGVD